MGFEFPFLMVDIHSHILWGLDDGATSREQSQEMLHLASETGTTDIVATPHANHQYAFRPEVNAERLAELQSLAPEGLRLHLGCDFHLNFENIEAVLAHPERYTIDGRGYLMAELPDAIIPPTIGDVFGRMIERGIRPVITHPERVPALLRDPAMLDSWLDRGCYLQITGQSLEGDFGSRACDFAWQLLSQDRVHFVASDGHDIKRRPPRLDRARALVEKKKGKPLAERLFVLNPRAAIEGTELESLERQSDWGSRWRRLFR
jgi:protein-tyrosine phosphatase